MQNLSGNRLFPFFWQHGEAQPLLLEELRRIRESGCGGFCVEARPHPDFLGPRWWQDMDCIMAYARQNSMQVWLLDDDTYPSGHCAGAFRKLGHPLANRFLACWCTDVLGSAKTGAMPLAAALPPDAELLAVLACARASGENTALLGESAVNLSAQMQNGWLRWQVPDGLWRVLALYTTSQGDGKRDYFNILDNRAVKLLLDTVYQPHYERYSADFGKTFCGFFSDEPEFGNLPGYNFRAKLGEDTKFLPWSDELATRLKKRWGNAFYSRLPALWYNFGTATPHLRYEYMDEVTKQIALSFTGQIGDWCRAHGVLYTGHVIEDDNAHGRLGCSTGHYFRSLQGMSTAGIDVVHLEIMPGFDQTVHQWVASDKDGAFFHYGLAKLGASLSHIDPKKQGDALCEIFGAYGWQEGCGLAKWLADHMLAGGINCFVPHAFSPKAFPDADCPPHFYAHGAQAQYPVFKRLFAYMQRLGARLSGGRPLPAAAVLYHADAEWAGEAMLYQQPVQQLLCAQIDCDVIPADALSPQNPYGGHFENGLYCAGNACYYALVIPACQFLPVPVADFIRRAAPQNFSVFFVGHRPEGLCELGAADSMLDSLASVPVVALEELAAHLRKQAAPPLTASPACPGLRVLPYHKNSETLLFCFNEDPRTNAETTLRLHPGHPVASMLRHDAWTDSSEAVPAELWETEFAGDTLTLKIKLAPGEAALYVCSPLPMPAFAVQAGHPQSFESPARRTQRQVLDGDWFVFARPVGERHEETLLAQLPPGADFPDLSDWAIREKFNGTLCYETCFVAEKDCPALLELPGGADAAGLFCGGECLGWFAGNPTRVKLILRAGENCLRIEMPLTPVYAAADPWSAMVMLPPPGLVEKPFLLFNESWRKTHVLQ